MIKSEETRQLSRGASISFERRRLLATERPHLPCLPHPLPDAAPAARSDVPDTGSPLTRALWDTLSDLVFVVRRDGVIVSFQAPPDCEYPLSAEQLVGRRIADLLPTAVGLQATHYLEKTLRTGSRQSVCYPFQLPGRLRTFQVRLAPCAPHEVLAVLRDVTDRAQMEKELLEISHREQMRIGQDLHDGLGQHLTGVTFLSRALEKKLANRGLPEAADAAEISRLVMQALSQTRSLARGLFPVELESKGLVAAFRELATMVEQVFHIPCGLDCDGDLVISDQTAATHLFRLAQEAINNAMRHGKAKHLAIELKQSEGRLRLTIRDDGVGFLKEAHPQQGLGLKIMQYRAQRLGGSLDVQSVAGSGTVVSCNLAPPG
jgi:PAS domain S-box-containing protein